MQTSAMLIALAASALTVPLENQTKGVVPDFGPAELGAKRIFEAIVKDDPASVLDVFFPAEPFDALKAIAKPRAYHEQLVKWFVADVHREHQRIKTLGPLVFDGFKQGRCKWKDKGSEANRIPYWSCYRNTFYARPSATGSSVKRIEFELRSMINWGQAWYVTHLGPIPAG